MKKLPFLLLLLSIGNSWLFAQNIKSDRSLLNTSDKIHFPSELALGQTWNRSLTKRVGQIIALEARRSGEVSVALPAFTYGESPYLVAELGIEMAKGLYTYAPVDGIHRIVGGSAPFQAAFARIIEESGILIEKAHDNLPEATPDRLKKEREECETVAGQAFRESIVLLKNQDNILPLSGAHQNDVITVFWDAETASHKKSKKELTALCKQNKPVVLVLTGKQAFEIDPRINQMVSAIVAAWFPDSVDKDLISDVVRGDYNPGSRLTTTIYDTKGKVIYPLGHGLSYTTVAYTDLTLEPDRITAGGDVAVRFRVTNTGQRTSDEVALLYVQKDSDAISGKDGKRLEAFKRTNLKPGETKEIKFTIRKRNVEVVDDELNRTIESGKYNVTIGNSNLSGSFIID